MIIMMMIIIFAQEALLTEMVSRAILKKNTGEHVSRSYSLSHHTSTG